MLLNTPVAVLKSRLSLMKPAFTLCGFHPPFSTSIAWKKTLQSLLFCWFQTSIWVQVKTMAPIIPFGSWSIPTSRCFILPHSYKVHACHLWMLTCQRQAFWQPSNMAVHYGNCIKNSQTWGDPRFQFQRKVLAVPKKNTCNLSIKTSKWCFRTRIGRVAPYDRS